MIILNKIQREYRPRLYNLSAIPNPGGPMKKEDALALGSALAWPAIRGDCRRRK